LIASEPHVDILKVKKEKIPRELVSKQTADREQDDVGRRESLGEKYEGAWTVWPKSLAGSVKLARFPTFDHRGASPFLDHIHGRLWLTFLFSVRLPWFL